MGALTTYCILDVSSAPLADAASYIDKAAIKAPTNYKKPEAIAAYVEEEYADRLARAGLDIDLAQITGVALWLSEDAEPMILTGDSSTEMAMLETVAAAYYVTDVVRPLVTFNGHAFDLPLLMRRALYLGVKFPELNLDRYRSPHCDVSEVLSDRNVQRRRSLAFYATRLQMGLTKTLSGEEESRVPVTGQWAELRESLLHDVTATKEVAKWAKLIR